MNKRTSPRSVFQESSVHLTCRQVHVSHHAASYEHILHRAQMWIFALFQHLNVVQLDVQILVDRLEGTADRDVVLELHGHSVVRKGLEEAVGEVSL